MNQEYQIKTTITDIEEKQDKNNNTFFKVWVAWELGKPRVFYAFSTDFNLKNETLQLLTNSPEKLINQRLTITYQEVESKDGNGTYYRIREIAV